MLPKILGLPQDIEEEEEEEKEEDNDDDEETAEEETVHSFLHGLALHHHNYRRP